MTRHAWLCIIFGLWGHLAFCQLHITQVESPQALKALFNYHKNQLTWISAHRGGSYLGYPENCIPTFEAVLKVTPAIIECDVRMTQDSVLILMHDETLERTTTGRGKVKEQSWANLQELHLIDLEGLKTDYRIPAFSEVLDWAVGKAILTVDVKQEVPIEKVVEAIEEAEAEAYAIVITYNLEDAKKVYQLNPALMISVTIRNEEEWQRAKNTGIPLDNMMAFVGITEPPASLYQTLHQAGLYCILGTMGNLDQMAVARGDEVYIRLMEQGADILSTDRPIEVAPLIKNKLLEQKE